MLEKMFGAFGARVHNNLLMVLSIEHFSQTSPALVLGSSIDPPPSRSRSPPPEFKTPLPKIWRVHTTTSDVGNVTQGWGDSRSPSATHLQCAACPGILPFPWNSVRLGTVVCGPPGPGCTGGAAAISGPGCAHGHTLRSTADAQCRCPDGWEGGTSQVPHPPCAPPPLITVPFVSELHALSSATCMADGCVSGSAVLGPHVCNPALGDGVRYYCNRGGSPGQCLYPSVTDILPDSNEWCCWKNCPGLRSGDPVLNTCSSPGQGSVRGRGHSCPGLWGLGGVAKKAEEVCRLVRQRLSGVSL